MKTRWKKGLAIIISPALFIFLCLLMMNLLAQHEVSSYKKALLAKGEKLKVAEVLPPPVPAGSNGIDFAEMAFKALGSGGIKN